MKKFWWVVIFFAIVAGHHLNAQVQGSAALEAGYIPESAVALQRVDQSRAFYASLDATLPILKYGFVNGEVTTYMIPWFNKGDNVFPVYGQPISDSYKFGVGVVIGPLVVGVSHECSHPVVPNGDQLVFGNASYTKIYAKYEWKF